MNEGPNEVYPDRALLVLCDGRDPGTCGFVRRMLAAFRGRAEFVDLGTNHALLALFPGMPTGTNA